MTTLEANALECDLRKLKQKRSQLYDKIDAPGFISTPNWQATYQKLTETNVKIKTIESRLKNRNSTALTAHPVPTTTQLATY